MEVFHVMVLGISNLTSMKNKVTSYVSFNLTRSPLRKPKEIKTDRSTQWSVYCCAVSNGTETRSQWVSIKRQTPSKFCYPHATFRRAISKMNDLELPVGGFVCHLLWSKTLRCKTAYLFLIKQRKIKRHGHISIRMAIRAWKQNTGSWTRFLTLLWRQSCHRHRPRRCWWTQTTNQQDEQ